MLPNNGRRYKLDDSNKADMAGTPGNSWIYNGSSSQNTLFPVDFATRLKVNHLVECPAQTSDC
jgi:hypothetical protein